MVRAAYKLAYLGWRFHGVAQQPGLRTVAGDIAQALKAMRLEWRGLSWASRTDRGVSALGNVLAVNIENAKSPEQLIPALNAHLTDIWFYACKAVGSDFSPRKALIRWYRYILRYDKGYDMTLLETASELFVGTHDFANFVKRSSGSATTRNIYAVDISRTREFVVFDFFGESFAWQLVRRLVGALLDVCTHTCTLADLQEALAEPAVPKWHFSVAPPENLILMDVNYGFEFDCDGRAVRHLKKNLAALASRAELRSMFLAMLRRKVGL